MVIEWKLTFDTMILLLTALIVVLQVREMKKATVAQAFSTVLQYLHSKESREARGCLINLDPNNFSAWTPPQKEKADIACSNLGVVANMLRNKVINHKMVTTRWHDGIVKCWENAQPMIKEYRAKRGADYWEDFDWLYKHAKKYKEK